MMNPIPGCFPQMGYAGHRCGKTDGTVPSDFQFPPVGPDLARPGWLLGGFGGGYCFTGAGPMVHQRDLCLTQKATMWRTFQWNIVDRVIVPKVPSGEYIT